MPKTAKRSEREQELAAALTLAFVERWEEEYRFHETRKWRFDFAWPDIKVAVEVEGGAWSGGRHTRGAGFVADTEKYNAAAISGWLTLRFVPRKDWIPATVETIKLALAKREREMK